MPSNVRTPRPVPMGLKFSGMVPAPPTPTLSDVMKRLSEVQANQVKIMNALNNVRHNQLCIFELVGGACEDLASEAGQSIVDRVVGHYTYLLPSLAVT